MPANTPSIVIRFELERRPTVHTDALDEAEERRLLDWIESRREYALLIARAYALAERRRP
jgi:hypothetical protein